MVVGTPVQNATYARGTRSGVRDFRTLGVWSAKMQAPKRVEGSSHVAGLRGSNSRGFENREKWLKQQSIEVSKHQSFPCCSVELR
jgi:hypothetical protein